MSEWRPLTQISFGEPVQLTVDAVSGVLAALDTGLRLLTASLEVTKVLKLSSLNLLEAILSEIVQLVEELLFDLMSFNISFALHINMNWNPYWVYNKEKERNSRTGKLDPRLVDFVGDRQFPWAGTGLPGYLLDILASSTDPTDPFRPVTDANTGVYSVMIVKGVANPADAESSLNFDDWINLFTNWQGFKVDFSRVRTDVNFESLAKLGTQALRDSMAPFVQMGPKEQQFLSVKKALVGNPMGAYVSDYIPTPGTYPKWASIPMASVVPPLGLLFANLQKSLGLIRFGANPSDATDRIIQSVKGKASALREAIAQVQSTLRLQQSLASFLTDSYIIVHKVDSGGLDVVISDILAADNAPDFGSAGIVVGVTFLATQPDAQATIDKFLAILGVKTSTYVDTSTVYTDALANTFSELFPTP